jgi:hypothetical protein
VIFEEGVFAGRVKGHREALLLIVAHRFYKPNAVSIIRVLKSMKNPDRLWQLQKLALHCARLDQLIAAMDPNANIDN